MSLTDSVWTCLHSHIPPFTILKLYFKGGTKREELQRRRSVFPFLCPEMLSSTIMVAEEK